MIQKEVRKDLAQVEDNKQVLGDFVRWLQEKRGLTTARQRLFLMKTHDTSSINFMNMCISKRGLSLTEHNVHKLRNILGLSIREMKELVLEMKGEVDGKEN